jgi:hypothetical protein
MSDRRGSGGAVLRVILWVARGLGLLVAAFVGFFVVAYSVGSEPSPPTFKALLYPIGPPIGYLLGWRWPLAGGVIGLGSIVAFRIWRGAGVFRFPVTDVMFLLPGLLFVAYGIATWARARRGADLVSG